FDLPDDCGMRECDVTAFWWYWRYTMPGYSYTVSYSLYDLDPQFCKVGPPLATVQGPDPMERWNHLPSFPGGLGMSDRVAIIASWDKGTLPYFCTDNNVKNYAAPNLCGGYALGPIRSFFWGGLATQYCPPLYLGDALGPVDCLMDASFWCWETRTEPTSWGRVKTLFR
ncbi:MAG: hypothetical protein ABIH26_07400, partial [Candidatus Eisenbacteria bacterium]